MTTFFEKGEVVFGKIKGDPWWPAIITDFNNNLIYTIQFYSDNSAARLSSKFLLKYEENKNKILEANKKNKKLLDAIKDADLYIEKNNKTNIEYNENNNKDNKNNIEKTKIKIEKKIQFKKLNNSYQNFELKKLEKKNNNNLINKTEIMSSQNNRVNIFSITKNNKNNSNINKIGSQMKECKGTKENSVSSEKKNVSIKQNTNNDIIINKNMLSLDDDDEISMLLNNKSMESQKKEYENGKEKILKKEKAEDLKEVPKDKEIKDEKEKYFINIEIESLEAKHAKKKEIKAKFKTEEKNREEKKRKEEDDFMYQIVEYLYKIFELFNGRKYEKLNYEKAQFKRILIFLSKYKRSNFIEFLNLTNINKFIQYFVCYLKAYDLELWNLAKKVNRNFHIQFNKDFFKGPKN